MRSPKYSLFLLWITILFGLGLFLPGQAALSQGVAPEVLVMDVHGPVAPAMQLYIERGLAYAADSHFALIVMQLNTPGGAIDTMTTIVNSIHTSPVPVAIYVSPRGAMAASAGTLITLSAQVSAMAPQTTIGAASPVGSQGQNIDTTEETKIKEVLKATARGLMTDRSPEAVTLAEQTIDNAKAATASEALQAGLVDFNVSSVDELVSRLNGYTVKVQGQPVTLNLQGARLVNFPPTLIEDALQFFTDPNLVFILLSAGIWAILIELSNPGGWVAGFAGAVLLIIALFGMGYLSVNWAGLLFLLLAFILFIVDIKAPTHGALTAAGAASFVAGGLILFNGVHMPGVPTISVPLVVGTGIFIAGSFFAALTLALRAQSLPLWMGHQTLVGKVGVIRAPVDPKGQIQVAGELWSVRMVEGERPLQPGERAEVVSIEGVVLQVKKAKQQE